MDSLIAQVEEIVADARRVSTPGAIGDANDRSGFLVVAPLVGETARRTTPSTSGLSVAIDGPGMFVFDERGKRVYGRLGDFRINDAGVLVDGAGRIVLGYGPDDAAQPHGALEPIRTAGKRGASQHFTSVAIDERGFAYGIRTGVDQKSGAPVEQRASFGRVALAIFPAPQRLQRDGETTVVDGVAAGPATFVFPGEQNVGFLRPKLLESGLVDLTGDFTRLWQLRQRGELEAATAFSSDRCSRVAMDLVK